MSNLPEKKKTGVALLKEQMNLPSIQEQFKNALGENRNLFVASLIDLYGTDNKLSECSPPDIIREGLKAAVLKLPINRGLGFAWIVPYNVSKKTDQGWIKVMKPSFQIGYKGYIQLAMRTGQYRTINTDVVYEGEFKKKDKLTGFIDLTGDKTSDTVIGYFSHLELTNGFTKTIYTTVEQITEHAKKFSKSYGYKDSPWTTDFDAMCMKTVLTHLLSKWGYLSIEMVGAISEDIKADTKEDAFTAAKQGNAEESMTFDDAEEVKDTPAIEQKTETPKEEPAAKEQPSAPPPSDEPAWTKVSGKQNKMFDDKGK